MDLLNIAGVLLTLAALFAYINHQFLRLPTTIGLMLGALLISLLVIAAGAWGLPGVDEQARRFLQRIDFDRTLLHGMLSFLLFAGALFVDLSDLSSQKWAILSLASLGVMASTFLVGGLSWLILAGLGHRLPLEYCLLFGALISPTDPISVLGILKDAGAPRALEATIAGEALFNDGVGVVVFLVLLQVATGGGDVSAGEVARLFAEEAIGGIVYGLALGAAAYYLLRSMDNYQVEILITLAVVTGGYALAERLHVSAPIAIVVTGLLVGNHGRYFAMSQRTREHLDTFWELVDVVLNAVLFVLIGLELLVLTFRSEYFLAGALLIPCVLFARLASVGLPMGVLRRFGRVEPHTVKLMTWGGLRGGISVAMALALPKVPARDPIIAITYLVVIFSIMVQGLSFGPVLRRLCGPSRER